MRAYQSGERWKAYPSRSRWEIESDKHFDGVADVFACYAEPPAADAEARARLIAESPLRDELLREIEDVICEAQGEHIRGLLARIRDTLARTEDR